MLRLGRVPRPTAWELANMASAVASRVAGKFISLAFIVILARVATPENFAAYSYLVALALLFVILSDTGMSIAAGRDVARGDIVLSTAYRSGIVGVVAAGFVGAIAVAIFGLVDSGPGSAGAALGFTALFVAVNAVFNYQATLLRSSGRHWIESILQVAGGVLFVVVGTVAVLADLGLGALMGAFALKEIVMVLIAQFFLPDPLRAPHRPGLWKHLLSAGLVMTVAGILLAVTFRAGQLVLGNVGSIEEIGRYAVAFRFLEASAVVCAAVGVGIGPPLCARFAGDERQARRAVTKTLVLTAGIAIVLTPVAVLVTPTFVTTLFGHSYEEAGRSAQVFVATTPLTAILFVAWFALIAQKRERLIALAATAGVAVSVAGAALIVAREDALSAALSTSAGIAVMTTVCVAAVLWKPTTRFPRTESRTEVLQRDGARAAADPSVG